MHRGEAMDKNGESMAIGYYQNVWESLASAISFQVLLSDYYFYSAFRSQDGRTINHQSILLTALFLLHINDMLCHVNIHYHIDYSIPLGQ